MTARNEAEKLLKVIRPYPVQRLYKYRSMDSVGLEDLICQRKIYLSDATKFNDPFECRPVLTHHQSPLKREILLKEMTKRHFPDADKKTLKKLMKGKGHLLVDPAILERVYGQFVSDVGIYCLTEKKDDLLMWSHYSNSHRGVCLEFDASVEETIFWEAFKIIYQEEYPVVNIMDMGKADEFRKALLTKSPHWMYEEERRVLKMNDEGGPGYYQFAPKLLTGIILGARMAEEDKMILSRWMGTYPTVVSIYQAKLHGSRYKLDITEVAKT